LRPMMTEFLYRGRTAYDQLYVVLMAVIKP
jgi:hypothetical protein